MNYWTVGAVRAFGCHVGYAGLVGRQVIKDPISLLSKALCQLMAERAEGFGPIEPDNPLTFYLTREEYKTTVLTPIGRIALGARWKVARDMLDSIGAALHPLSKFFIYHIFVFIVFVFSYWQNCI
jgi:hypothetical protein